MATLNRLQVIGYLGQNPEQKSFNGSSFVTFSVSTSERYKGRDGQDVEKTDWHSCNVSNPKTQEYIMKYVHQGDLVLVEGAVHYSEKDGKKYTNIAVMNVQLLSSRDKTPAPSGNAYADDLPV